MRDPFEVHLFMAIILLTLGIVIVWSVWLINLKSDKQGDLKYAKCLIEVKENKWCWERYK